MVRPPKSLDLNYRIGRRSYITKLVRREERHVGWLHCSHQEQEGVFFFIYQYRQSLLAIASVEHETISAISDRSRLGVRVPCLPPLFACRPERRSCVPSQTVRQPFSPSSIEPRAHPTRTTTAANVNGILDRNGDVLSAVYGRLGLPSRAYVSTWTPLFGPVRLLTELVGHNKAE